MKVGQVSDVGACPQAGLKTHLSLSSACVSLHSFAIEKGGICLATSIMDSDFIEAVASEMAAGIDAAVECWMTQIERALENTRLTTLGRLQAIQDILANYKRITGKAYLVREGICGQKVGL